jgi:hypothetical protein
MGIIMQQCNILHYHLLAFCSDGWFWLVPEGLIVMDTLQCCVTLSYCVVYFLAVACGPSSYPQWLCVKVWKCTTDFCSWHTSGQKNNILLLLFGADGKWSIHINFVMMMLQLQFNIWTSQHCWEFMCILAFTVSSITNTKEIFKKKHLYRYFLSHPHVIFM